MVFSNVNGVALADPRYEVLWAKANALGAVVYIHPTNPVGVEAMTEYWLMPLLGFTFDTTLAAAKLVFSGVVERHPRIRWSLCHLGGAIPYLAERLDRGFHAFAECRAHIDRPPSEYLRRFYYDTVNFDPGALGLAIWFAGPDRVLAGSDYPHQIGSIERMKASLERLPVTPAEREAIAGRNAERLLAR
jgi:aminocarboxymuconate-semialdehyde decarboxylase